MTSNATDRLDVGWLNRIRATLDDLKFSPITLGSTTYKAVFLCDSQVYYRIHTAIATIAKDADTRSPSNPVLAGYETLSYFGMLFINCPRLSIFRPAYSGGLTWGPITPTDPMITDPRTYTNGSTKGLMIGLGGAGLLEGYNDSIEVTDDNGKHGKGKNIAAHMLDGFVRGEWYANDGRATTDPKCFQNFSSLVVISYEPGVGL